MNRRRHDDYKTVPTNRVFFFTVIVTLLALAMCTSGCSTTGRYERAWQTSHAIDFAQTMHIAASPECFREVNPLTRALVGEHPSKSEVTAVMAGYALAHYGINRWLEGKAESTGSTAWHGTLRFFQASTLLLSVRTVARNHSIGLRPLGSGCDAPTPAPSYDPSVRPLK